MRKDERAIAIYSRKSKFTGKGDSIGNQIELCMEHINSHFEQDKNNVKIFEDEGYSGKNLNRPKFKNMLELARAKKIKMIIVYRLDRISRNIGDFAILIDELSRLGIAFVSIREQFDTNSPMGRAMMYIASIFSQLERETIAERIRDNMYELAKTGRWLGGNSPTGFESESVTTVTIDGKARKACKLKEIFEEKNMVRIIYQIFKETDSLTVTEAELIKRGIKSKNNNYHTRFSIKTILQNPVYMIADEVAYEYFASRGAEISLDKSLFDGEHGIMAYNRTDQEKGRATIYLPISEWIISVGLHQGFISSCDWIAVQESLERNKSKSYRKPRNNEALLTGLIFCSCGSRMYPKLTTRKTKDGQAIFSYMCKMKERSKRSLCDNKNISGNILDSMIVEQIKMLEEDTSSFTDQLEKAKKFYMGDKIEYGDQLKSMQKEKTELENKMNALVDSLIDVSNDIAKNHIVKRIEELGKSLEKLNNNISELENLTSKQSLTEFEFDLLRQLLSVFKDSVDKMTIEQKRAAIRTIVRKVVWDGTNAHVVLFGSEGDIAEYPSDIVHSNFEDNEDGSDDSIAEHDILEDFDGDNSPMPGTCKHGDGKVLWGEDSKCDPNANETILIGANDKQWHMVSRYSESVCLLLYSNESNICYSPMYTHAFKPMTSHNVSDILQTNSKFKNYEDIGNVFDRMKWCRLSKGLMQRDVAKMIGTTRSNYQALEAGKIERFNMPLIEKIAGIYEISVDDLLDDYNRFIYYGQGEKISQYRSKLKLGRQSFAKYIGADFKCIRDWENEVRPISKQAWEKYFKDI